MAENTSEFILRSAKEFGIYVNTGRHIPFIGDGLKTVQRIALYLLADSSSKRKTLKLVGEMMDKNLYVHGDAAAGEAISRLASPYVNNLPLIGPDSDGGFGSRVNPAAFSAARYTYIKRSKLAERVLYPDMELAPRIANYDNSTTMPMTFLPLIPTVLLNGISGIGVGYATKILPRDFDDLVNAVVRVLDGEAPGKLIPCLMGQDTTFTMVGKPKPDEARKWVSKGKISREGNRVMITALPYETTVEAIKERLIELEESGEVHDFVNHSSDGISIEVRLNRAMTDKKSDDDLMQMLYMVKPITEHIVVLAWDQINIVEYFSAQKVVEEFVAWRLGYYETRYKTLLADERRTLLYWQSVVACFHGHLAREAPKLAGRKELLAAINANVQAAKLALDENITERISQIPLYRWTIEAEAEAKKKIAEAKLKVSEYEDILKSPKKLKLVYRNEVSGLRAKEFLAK